MNNIMDADYTTCTGCGVCVVVCPHQAIGMILNEDGYYVAEVDDSKCTSCQRCKTVCSKFKHAENEILKEPQKMLVGKHNELEKQRASASGGIGQALAEVALENGYDVIGASLDISSMRVQHVVIKKADELSNIRGSKYVPSYTPDAFSLIKDLPKVIIFALPCQAEALRRLYGNRTGMILVDLRCAGPAGYNLLDKYIEYLNSINSSGIQDINMRAKDDSWFMWGVKTVFKDGSKYFRNKYNDLFGVIFNQFGAVHQVCWDCKALKNLSAADIRIEDAWHQINNINKHEFLNGISQISTFTKQGEEFLKLVHKNVDMHEVELEKYQTYLKKKEPEYLMKLLREHNRPLKEIYREYRKTISLKKKIRTRLEIVVSKNKTIYNYSEKIYKMIFKG